MPRINAPTVREHHEQVMTSLIDAAEQILREEGPGALTAGAVSSRAGGAPHTIFRHGGAAADLPGLVAGAIANLEQATIAGHGWLMRIGEGRLKPNAARTVGRAHAALYAGLDRLWGRINPDRARIASIMTQGLLVAMMNAVERRAVGLDEAREELRGAVLLLIDRYEVDDRGGRPAG